MGAYLDLTGQTFGLFNVLRHNGRNKHGHNMWLCKCECGNERSVSVMDLRGEKSTSCGCVGRAKTVQRNYRHGKANTTEHRSWKAMKNRCYNSKLAGWKDYGGRGIKVCDRWLKSFENFYADMGKKPSMSYSIERIDNDGNYEPGNCRWATKKEQNRNTRQNNLINTPWGRIPLVEVLERTGLSKVAIKGRLKRNVPESELLKPTKCSILRMMGQ